METDPTTNVAHRLPSLASARVIAAVAAVACVAAAVAAYLLVPEIGAWTRQAGNLLRSAEVQGIRMLLHRSGTLEPLAAATLGVYVALVPTLPLAPLAEAVVGRLGAVVGVGMLTLGLFAGSTAGFALTAALLRPLVLRLPGVPRDRFPRLLPWLALLARAAPWIGQGWVSYLTGALPMRMRDHLWSAAAGTLAAVVLALLL